MYFKEIESLSTETISFIVQNLECTNEEPIVGDIPAPNSIEIKRRAKDVFASQNRAVTRQDYISTVYSMPPKFGAIKRCNIVRDHDALKRNLNLYVVSESARGILAKTNDSIKQNLKVWLAKNKMINDTIDILDARILNFGIDFSVVGDVNTNRYEILESATRALRKHFSGIPDVSERFYISDVYSVLNDVVGVVDVIDVEIRQLFGGVYSDLAFDVDGNISIDGRFIKIPEDMIWEVRFPHSDIRGVVK